MKIYPLLNSNASLCVLNLLSLMCLSTVLIALPELAGAAISQPVSSTTAAPVSAAATTQQKMTSILYAPPALKSASSVSPPGAIPVRGEETPTKSSDPVIYSDVGERLRSEAVAKQFRSYNATHGRHIQQALYDIYQDNPIFQKEYKNEHKLLRDNIVGPVTLKWIQKFCNEYNIQASDTDFSNQVISALMHVSAIANEHADWQKTLLSSDFEDWINQQSTLRQTEIYKIRRSQAAAQINALLNEYQQFKSSPAEQTSATVSSGIFYSYQWQQQSVNEQQSRAELVKKLASLIGSEFDTRLAFESAVQAVLKEAKLDIDQNLPIVLENAQTISYELAPSIEAQLKVMGAPADLIDALPPLYAQTFLTIDAFQDELNAIVPASVHAALAIYRPKIIEYAQVSKYAVTAATLDNIANTGVPPVILRALQDIVGIDYPTEALLESAIAGKLRSAILPCPANVSITENKFNADEFAALLQFLGNKPQLLAELSKFRQQTAFCKPFELERVKLAIAQVFDIVLPRLKKQTQFAVLHKNPPVYKDKHQWKSESCSCVLDTLSGEIIGFYPFWLDMHQKTLNFSLITRINLYGLTFDEQGNFTNSTSSMAPRWPAEFFGIAKKYGSAVDWVIYKNDWRAWSRLQNADKKTEVLDNLIANIVKLLSGKLNSVVLNNAGDDQTPKGDGVTLYFDQFPSQDTTIFNEFLKNLHTALNNEKAHPRINIMASHSALNTSIDNPFSYLNLSKQIELLNDIPKLTSDAKRLVWQEKDIRVLALLESPTTDSKKALRSEIEMALHGQERKRLLRDTIPVLEYDGHNWQQLNDDIIYFNDNFAGIGFWPLTVQTGVASAANGDVALKSPGPDDLLLTNMVSESTSLQSRACTFICPHRTEFRIGFVSSLLLVLLMSAIYLSCCSCRIRLKEKPYMILYWVVVAAPALLLLALSVCDPEVKHFVTTYSLIICVLVCVTVYAVSLYVQNRTNRPKP